MNEKTPILAIHSVSIDNIAKEYNAALPYYQFLMVLSGSLHIHSETFGSDYATRDIIILHPGKSYHISPVTDNLVLTLNLEKYFVSEQLGSSCEIFCDSREEPQKDYTQLRNLIASIASSYCEDASEKRLTIYSLLFSLLALIQKNYLVSTINLTAATENGRHLSRIQEIRNYIEENYASAITLASLAESLYLSPQYLSKFIRQHFHQTFYDYLNQVRIRHALAEIQYTDLSITKIAFNSGFPNLTAFNKVFKELYHTTPSSYRREFLRHQEQSPQNPAEHSEDSSHIHKNFDDVKAYLSDMSGQLPDIDTPHARHEPDTSHYVIHANARDHAPLSNPMTCIVNAGFAINMLSSDFMASLTDALQTVRFTYIRIIGILDPDILPKIDDASQYNFSNVDIILDYLYEHQCIPFLELSVKPRKTTVATTHEGFLANPSIDSFFPEEHYKKLKYFIRHCINRYGEKYVSSWYFEIWAAHTDYLKYIETPEQYAQRFKKIKGILRAHLPNTVLGGPGFNTSAPSQTLGAFLTELGQSRIEPDFISLYLYPYSVIPQASPERTDEYIFFSPDRDVMARKLRAITDDLRKYCRHIPPVFITEFNSDLAGQNHINDSCFQAAFICHNFLAIKDQIQLCSYWLFTDLTEEYMPRPSTKSGGIGLVNSQGQKKPAFFAYEFLDQLGSCVLCEGENYIITRAGHENYRILVFNYAHVNKYYCLNHTDQVNVQDTYSVFDTVMPVNISFQIYNLPPGQYKIKKHTLNRDHGSLLDQMSRMWLQGNLSFERLSYNINNLSLKEREYFARTCIPAQTIFYKNSDGDMTLNCKVSAHEVLFYEISKEY